MTKIVRPLVIILLLVLIVSGQIKVLIKNSDSYKVPYFPGRYQELKNIYGESQYVLTKPKHVIPDEFVYSYAAAEYLRGVNPVLLNAEQPPLGKYLIGVSQNIFNNDRTISFIFNIGCLIALFILGSIVLKDGLVSLLIVYLFSLEKLFMAQAIYAPLLDNIQLFFILLSFIFFTQIQKKPVYLFFSMISLGLVMSTKFYLTGILIVISWLLSTFFTEKGKIIRVIVKIAASSIFAIVTMMFVYFPMFMHGDNLRRFFGVQKWMYSFHLNKFNFQPDKFFGLVLFNKWHNPGSSGANFSVDWQITWPLVFINSLIILFLRRKSLSKDWYMIPIAFWVVVYSLSVVNSNVVPRYLIPILPFWYIMFGFSIKKLMNRLLT